MNLEAYVAERGELVEKFLERCLVPRETPPTRLHAAIHHLIFPGGKRFRPLLALAAAEAVGGRPEAALPLAAAVELVHTYSLIHDDLPCMDDDAERRGRPAVHVAFDEATAVLAGDALLAEAFRVLAASAEAAPAEALRLTLLELAEAASSRQLVGGQADDLAFSSAESDPARIESVHLRKTAALIVASVVGGARLAGAEEATLTGLRRFGEATGVAFQIADDLLDRDDGEPCSWVRVLGPDAAAQRAEALLAEALAQIESLGAQAEPLRELARYAVRRKR